MSGHVVVVGAGLGGLACAAWLAGSGRRVTVLERGDRPGGVAGQAIVDGHRFDTGPTVLTAPEILERTFAAAGARLADHLELLPLDPAYRGHFADGSTVDVITDRDRMAAHVAERCGPADAEGYLRYAEHVTDLYRLQRDDFIDADFDTPLDLLTANLFRLLGRGGFGRLSTVVDRHFGDERLRRLFSFQALYAGLAPRRALALYAVISYLDAIAGVHYPRGGMHRVPEALTAAITAAGADIRYATEASAVDVHAGRVTAVRTADGDRIACDAVVLNTDPATARRLLGLRPPRRHTRSSPSCVVLHVATTGPLPPELAHHNVYFGRHWHRTFADIIDAGRVMRDPSLLVTNPGRTDPERAGTLYVLAPAPNLATGRPIDWSSRAPAYTRELLGILATRGLSLNEADVKHTATPTDWAAAGHPDGTPFALSHTFFQTGPFRPTVTIPGISNAAICGAHTRPGVGVPMVLLSGRLAATRITHPIDPHP